MNAAQTRELGDVRVLDLFSGLDGWSQAAKDRGHEVVTVELDPKFSPTILGDLMDIPLPGMEGPWDVVLASPPCESFSIASISTHWETIGDSKGDWCLRVPKTDQARQAMSLVGRVMWWMMNIETRFWYMENPRGMMRKIVGPPTRTVTYCRFGDDRMKPTDLWGRHAPMDWPPMCKNGTKGCHAYAPRGSKTGTQGRSDYATRSLVPYGLSMAVCIAVENAIAGESRRVPVLESFEESVDGSYREGG